MSQLNPLLWRKPPAILSYGIAVLSVTATVIISRWPAAHLEAHPAALFLCAVMISAWLGGAGPGLLATVLSCVAFYYYFLEPLYSFAVKPQEIPRFVIFIVSAIVASSLSAAQRSATESLRRARDYLTETVKELQRTNDALQAESRERMNVENRLRRSEGYLAEAQRLTHTGSFGWSVQSGEIRWSDETFRIFECDPKTKPRLEVILQKTHPDDLAYVKETIERASQERKDLDFEHRLLMQDDSIKYIRVVAHAVRDKSGEIEFVGAVMDTTEGKRAEKKLRRSEESLLEAQKLSHTGSWRHDIASAAIEVSPEIYRMHDITPDEDPSKTEFFFGRFHPEDRKRVVDLFEKSETGKTKFEVDYRIVLPDGTIKYLHTIGRPVLSESGDLVEFVGTAMDLTAAKQAEEALRRSESYLAEAQRLSHTGSFASSPATGEIKYLSEECYRVLGFDPHGGQPRYETFIQRIVPEDQGKVRGAVETAGRENSQYELEYRIVHPGGEIRDIHVIGHPVLSPRGDVVEFVGTVIDITERKRAEGALGRSEAYLTEAQRLSHTGSWAWIPATGEISYLSEECYRVLGFDPHGGETRDEMFFQGIHPDDHARVREAIETADRENSDFELDHRIIHPGGEIRDIHVIGHPILGPSGTVVEFVGTVIDITERKRAEGALGRSEAYLAEAQRLAHTGSWAYSIDAKGLIHSSEEHRRLFGFDPERGVPAFEELIQRIHPEDRAPAMQEFESSSRAGTDFDAHFRIVRPDGTTKYVYGTGHPVFNASGDAFELVGTVMDVTERRRAEEERERLRQAQADLARVNRVTTMGELTASLAHEVNQPIGAAVTNASTCLRWLAADTPNLEEARAAAMRVVTDGKRAAEIISRVRQLFKKGALERELVDVNEIIREVIVLLQGEAERHSILVTTDLAEDIRQLMADRVQLQQVMMNLIVNSIDAMKNVDGTRELAIASRLVENEEILVSVSDTGVGLPQQQADQIFNAFFTTKLNGTGMGLRISGTIVESHGGRLWAEHNSPRGATFHVTLPTNIEAHE
jgi:PAS domain S-box-containing protein